MPLAVIVPARDAAATLQRCLTAIRLSAGARADIELLVVDDGSTDDTSRIAVSEGVRVIRQASTVGPAAARNAGAQSTGAELLFFVDADVVVAGDAIPRVLAAFEADPDLAAVFGSYDASPQASTLVSDYRNLLHHFTHQNSREQSQSFWAGCGAVRRSVFVELGGFDERYRRPSIEDVEFGWRCATAGYRIRLDKQLQGTHLKRWTLPEVVRVDVRDRAYPWSRLILRNREMPTELNLQLAHRVSAILVWTALLSSLGTMFFPTGWRVGVLLVAGLCLVGVMWLNRSFYGWLARRRGLRFLAVAFWLHLLYYAYSSATFGWAWLRSGRDRAPVYG